MASRYVIFNLTLVSSRVLNASDRDSYRAMARAMMSKRVIGKATQREALFLYRVRRL